MLNQVFFRGVLFVIILFSFSLGVSGQNVFEHENIKQIYGNEDLEKKLLKEIDSARSLMFYDDELEKGIAYSKELIKKTKSLKQYHLEARIHHILGYAYAEYSGDLERAIKEYFKAKAYYDKHPDYEREITLLLNIANAYFNFQSYQESIEYNLMGVNMAQKVNDYEEIAGFDNNLGICYEELGEDRIAARYYYKASQYFKEVGDTLRYYEIQVNLLSGDLRKAYSGLNNKELIVFLKDAIKVFNRNGRYQNSHICRQHLAQVYRKLGKYDIAVDVMKEIESDTNYIPAIFQMNDNNKAMAEVYRDMGDHPKEAKYLWKYLELHDTVYTLKRTKAVADVRTKYDTERKEIENQVLRSKEELNKSRLENAKLESRSLYLGLGIVGVVAILVLAGFFISQRQRKIIANQKKEVDTAYAILETKNNEIMDSINYAQRIQGAILPSDENISKHIPDSFVLYRPKDIVAGDFYWLELSKSKSFEEEGSDARDSELETVLFAAADCTGHGVPGAMVSVVCNNGLNRAVREYGLQKPGEILDKTREIVIEEFQKGSSSVNEASPSIKDGMDIALVNIQFKKEGSDTKGAIVEYAGANNPIWIFRKEVYQVEEIKADKQPIGQFHNQKPFETHTIRLNKGDTFYIFTDGYADQFGRDQSKAGGKKLKSSNFKKLLLSIQHMTMPEQKKHLSDFFNNWKGELEQLDDVCVIGVRV